MQMVLHPFVLVMGYGDCVVLIADKLFSILESTAHSISKSGLVVTAIGVPVCTIGPRIVRQCYFKIFTLIQSTRLPYLEKNTVRRFWDVVLLFYIKPTMSKFPLFLKFTRFEIAAFL